MPRNVAMLVEDVRVAAMRAVTGEVEGRVPTFAVRLVREGALGYGRRRQTIRTPGDAAQVLWALIGEHDREAFAVLMLNTRHEVLGAHIVAVGPIDSCPTHPREVFKAALLANAAAVILGHNHPSGNPEPSGDDGRITERLADAGQVLGIEVLDHVIVAVGEERRFVSLRERGTFTPRAGVRG